MFDVTVEKRTSNTVISCWVGNSMESDSTTLMQLSSHWKQWLC